MGLIGGMARTAVAAGTWTAVSNRVSRRQYNRWAEQDQQYYQQPAPAAPAPQPDRGGRDPIVAAVDLWALSVQHDEYFAHGDGRNAFGPLQPVAQNAVIGIENDVRAMLAGSMKTGEIHPETIQHVHDWAAEHPIRVSMPGSRQ